MRITGGTLRGRQVGCPPGEIRPTTDQLRESLFAILGDLTGCSFLDLFSGSGVTGLEAASRGAAPVFLVERDRGKAPILRQNADLAPMIARVMMASVERFLKRCPQPFDLVFLDPPFREEHKVELLKLATGPTVAAPGATVMLHLPARETVLEQVGGFQLVRYKRYGQSGLCLYSELVSAPGPASDSG